MDFRNFKNLVKNISIGKELPDAIYVHETALDAVPLELAADLARAVASLALDQKEWNVIKFFKRDHKVALLNYPRFSGDAYPALEHAYTVDLEKGTFRESDYRKSDNPPILHRKETLLKPNHPSVPLFRKITEEGEKVGLYANPRSIGFKKSWELLISRKGYVLNEQGRLKPKASAEIAKFQSPANGKVRVERHLTAIDRDKLSAPMQALARHNYLHGDYSVFDYGCGKGDDVRELEAHGLDIAFWDPVYHPEGTKKRADIVNLGYVINVIEERKPIKGDFRVKENPGVGLVSLDEISPYLEADRATKQGSSFSRNSEERIKELKDILSMEGQVSPLELDYDPNTGKAFLRDGNHRVAAMKQLGWTHAVIRVDRANLHGFGVDTKLKPTNTEAHPHGFGPIDLGLGEPKPEQAMTPFTAALRFPNDEIQVAKDEETTHAQMFDRLFNREKHPNLISEHDPEVDTGFVDSKGRYYSRGELSSYLGYNADTFGGVENNIKREQSTEAFKSEKPFANEAGSVTITSKAELLERVRS